jgi:drug/metabolite transporter (DMT)-like permease
MSWVPIALLCAFSLALADALSKRRLSHLPTPTLTLVRAALPGVLLLPAMPWVLASTPLLQLPMSFWGWLLAAMPLEVLAITLYTRAIQASPLSQTLPYLALTPVLTVLTGWVLLGESVSPRGLLGILLVAAGTWGLNLEHAGWHPHTWLSPFRAMLRQRGARLMLAVASIYAVTAALSKGAVNYMDGLAFGVVYFVALSVAAFAWYGLRTPRAAVACFRGGRWAWGVAALMALMVVTHFWAQAQTTAAYMIAVKRISVLFGLLLGAWMFKEARLAQHLGAAALMVAGVALVVA